MVKGRGVSNHRDGGWYQLEKEREARRERYQRKKAAEAEAAAAAEPATPQPQTFGTARTPFTVRSAGERYRGLYDAFKTTNGGKQRSDNAAERAAQRAVKRINDALPAADDKAQAALKHAFERGRLGVVAAEVGVMDSFAQRVLGRIKDAFASMGVSRGSLSADVEGAVDSFLNLAAPEPQTEVLQRGRQAKRQRGDGGTVQAAAVVDVREWADALGLSITTAWRRLKGAIERRSKLDAGEDASLWIYFRERIGHGISAETKRLVYDFYVDHPGIKRSPMVGDVLKIKDEHGEQQTVAKLLSEVSLTDVYLDFEKAHPDLLKERAFRDLRPPELRRMSKRHLDMCGCR